MTAASRETTARRALKLLGEERFSAFVHAVGDDSPIIAVRRMREALDAGTALDAIFFTGDEFGFELSAASIGPNRFAIEFGCQAGPLAGDGGAWEVQYEADGSIPEIIPGDMWIY